MPSSASSRASSSVASPQMPRGFGFLVMDLARLVGELRADVLGAFFDLGAHLPHQCEELLLHLRALHGLRAWRCDWRRRLGRQVARLSSAAARALGPAAGCDARRHHRLGDLLGAARGHSTWPFLASLSYAVLEPNQDSNSCFLLQTNRYRIISRRSLASRTPRAARYPGPNRLTNCGASNVSPAIQVRRQQRIEPAARIEVIEVVAAADVAVADPDLRDGARGRTLPASPT